jgi:hypothetical protein
VVEFPGDQTFNHFDKFAVRFADFFAKVFKFYAFTRGTKVLYIHIAPYSILTEILLVIKASWYIDLSLALVATMHFTISIIKRIRLI